MENELKPCPFCGGKPRRKQDSYNLLGAYGTPETERKWFSVYCTSCKTEQPKRLYGTRKESDEMWNRRCIDGT